MSEAFVSSHHFMTHFAAWTGLLLAALATAVPVLQALAAAAASLSHLLRRALAGRPAAGAGPSLSSAPLRPDLPAAIISLAGHTRALLASLEPAVAAAHLWRDRAAPRWLGDRTGREFAPTIGVTGEVWSWLQSAESLLEDPASAGVAHTPLERAASEVRAALFSGAPLPRRLHAIVETLTGFDAGLRGHASVGYRGVTTRAPIVTPVAEVAEDEDADEGTLQARRFQQVLERYDDSLRAVARRYARGAACDDLHQEIRLGVWRALPGFRGEASLKTYALRIARYCGARFARKQRPHEPEIDIASDAPSVDEDLDARRRRHALMRAFAALPANQREALGLKLAGHSYREIASRLQISESNVSVRITRARKTLRRCAA